MFFPYSTDAPIYYWPIATVLLIVVNIAVFFAESVAPESAAPFVLMFGHGLHPVQWLTNNFLHAGIVHLLGNMVSLWSFGLIVEGKLGWQKTLAVYLGICVVYGAIVQLFMLGSSGFALGASGAVFGLMAMSLVWAPENNMQCLLLLVVWPIYFEIRVVVLVGLFLSLQIGLLALNHMAMSSEMLHVVGAALGFPVAIWMLKKGMVDCENWDVFSVWAGRHAMSPEELRQADELRSARKQADKDNLPADLLLDQIRQVLRGGKPLLALKAHQRMSSTMPDWTLPREVLWDLIQALHGRKLWAESAPLMEEYLEHYPHQAALVQLKLSHILLTELGRPDKALNVIAKIDRSALDAPQRELLEKLRARAELLQARS